MISYNIFIYSKTFSLRAPRDTSIHVSESAACSARGSGGAAHWVFARDVLGVRNEDVLVFAAKMLREFAKCVISIQMYN